MIVRVGIWRDLGKQNPSNDRKRGHLIDSSLGERERERELGERKELERWRN